ncbi:hypothetical protein ONE63_011219 [Megalurothrips usitatus]|uniref:PLAC domain-containing protein n=1 Tax=Megalurothrips usitatus TaxID=439358 RepID=A0AAV7WZW3_9NEOP|nr:hypothetical protein ONE63_011219 [Megalurothrips usitatus]
MCRFSSFKQINNKWYHLTLFCFCSTFFIIILCLCVCFQRVGCDGVVGSSARADACGVCGGDNSTCRAVSGIFTRPQLPPGLNVIALLPQGACNLSIAQLRPTRNLLSLRRVGGSPVLNSGRGASWPGVYEAGGTRFTYGQADGLRAVGESLSAPGPLTEPLELLLLYQQPNPGIKYEYALPVARRELSAAGAPPTALASPLGRAATTTASPRDAADNEVADDGHRYPFDQDVPAMDSPALQRGKGRKYVWRVTGLSECSKTCGGGTSTPRRSFRGLFPAGTQQSVIHCVRENSLLPVSEKRCQGLEKPPSFPVRCGTRPCPAQWVTGDWSGCSVTCGTGTQTREQTCRQEISSTLTVHVDHGACLGARPECSSECGRGLRTRAVSCPAGGVCPAAEQPPAQEPCDAGPCATAGPGPGPGPASAHFWLASDWSSHCSAECGTGVQSRSVACSAGPGAAAAACEPRLRPAHTRACSAEPSGGASCRGQWFSAPWGPCSTSCGQGVQSRGVACVQWQRGQGRYQVQDDEYCDARQRPEQQQPCAERTCPPHWYAGEWSECSRSCGTGAQKREVRCIGPAGPSTACSEDSKLPTRKPCQVQEPSYVTNESDTQDEPADAGVLCEDRLRNCHLVVQARLCKYSYYGTSCCHSCRRKGE